jgi:nucleoside-triphosphatase THEP1
MGQSARIGLLTGPVGVGKTTVAERVVGQARRRGLVCGGLLTPAMSTSCGQKAGIWGLDLLRAEGRILARTDRELDGPTVGPYSFGAAALAWANGVLEQAVGACDLLIVDEIGKLELWRGIGLAPILVPLTAGKVSRSLVVVREELLSELQGTLRAVEQVIFEVSEANRDDLAALILDGLMSA